mmetsp:Transcript_29403/g.87201  ORF Transcript_29403/g.87201 Transcript_29403/m.87201 type:complete len:86 (+) Transcript_29403:1108-1365(+)
MQQLCTRQRIRAAERAVKGEHVNIDDEIGEEAVPCYFVDDGSILLPLPDAEWHFDEGERYGCKSNKSKNVICLGILGGSTLDLLP